MNILDLINNVSTQTLKKGDIIFRQGQSSNGTMYYIFEGSLAVIKETEGKKPQKIHNMKENDFFGEMGIVTQYNRAATIIVESETARLGVLHKDNFIKIIKLNPEFLFHLLKKTIERLNAAEKRLEEVSKEFEEKKDSFIL